MTTPDKKRGRKITPGSSGTIKSSNNDASLSTSPNRKRHKSDSSLKDANKTTANLSTGKKSNSANTSDDSDNSDEEKKKEKPKPFMRETLSGRQPKPPERYAEKTPKKKGMFLKGFGEECLQKLFAKG